MTYLMYALVALASVLAAASAAMCVHAHRTGERPPRAAVRLWAAAVVVALVNDFWYTSLLGHKSLVAQVAYTAAMATVAVGAVGVASRRARERAYTTAVLYTLVTVILVGGIVVTWAG